MLVNSFWVLTPVKKFSNLTFSKVIWEVLEKVFSLFLLLLMLPVIILCGILIYLFDKQYPIFVQKRQGLTGTFDLYKLKTMVDRPLTDDEQEQYQKYQKLDDDPRCTPLGKILRVTSLDELPQLWNVVKGDMSLVGPRPVMVSQQKNYFGMKPGITGLTQAKYRNKVKFESRKHLERFYANHKSFAFDCYIVILTVLSIIKMNGK